MKILYLDRITELYFSQLAAILTHDLVPIIHHSTSMKITPTFGVYKACRLVLGKDVSSRGPRVRSDVGPITLRLRTLFKIEDLSIPKVPKGKRDGRGCGRECFKLRNGDGSGMAAGKVVDWRWWWWWCLKSRVPHHASAQGSKIAVVGANGCGKSTLLSYLSGREQPKEGEIRLQLGLFCCKMIDVVGKGWLGEGQGSNHKAEKRKWRSKFVQVFQSVY